MAAASTEPARGGLPSPDGVWHLSVSLRCEADVTTLAFTHRLAEPYDANSIGPGWHYYYYLDRLGAVTTTRSCGPRTSYPTERGRGGVSTAGRGRGLSALARSMLTMDMNSIPNPDPAPGTVIRVGSSPITLINVFTVEPDQQQRLVDLLDSATAQVMRHRSGFVSANLHASLDGTRVVNYAQWQDQASFEAMLADPAAREHMDALRGLATVEPRLYDVASTHHS